MSAPPASAKSASILKRLAHEMHELDEDPPENVTAAPENDDDMFRWSATIVGPEGTPYESGIFRLKVVFPEDYPYKPPRVTFLTRIQHCNIAPDGSICLDILQSAWSPALTISTVLSSISSLLAEPNPDDPFVPELAQLYRTDRKKHDELARACTKNNAM